MTLYEMEKKFILDALEKNKSLKATASELGIGLSTLYRRLNKYKVSTPYREKKKCTGQKSTSQFPIHN